MRCGLSLLCMFALGCGRLGFDELEPLTTESARGTLSVGIGFACTLRDGDVWCWGEAGAGQLGAPDLAFAAEPVRVPMLPAMTFVAAGNSHVCAVSSAGDVYCWGNNDSLQLGVMTLTEKPGLPQDATPEPKRVATLPGPAISVGAAAEHSCALLVDRTVWCWGSNRTGQLGRGTIEEVAELPAVVPGLADVAELALADDSSCVRHTSGAVSCWGEGGTGHLGDGTTANRGTPGVIPNLTADALTLGGDHACALVGGHYTCWGNNGFGQHGTGSDQPSNRPQPPSLLDGFVAITASFNHTCALGADGSLLCWGANFEGTLGSGDTESRSSPVRVELGGRAAAVAAGLYSTCAVREDTTVLCWGWGSRGGIGDGRSARARPQAVGIAATQVAARRTHSCALTSGGNAACWGRNDSGQLGNGTFTSSASPVTVTRMWTADAVSITVGDAHSCVRTAAGEIWCWGANGSGQLGDNSTESRPTPVQAMTDVMSSVAAGDIHTCGIRTVDFNVLCWGYNEHGSLGNGSTTDSLLPVQVIDGTGTPIIVSALAVGETFACALRGSDVVCWGINDRGQLGVTGGDRDNATQVPGIIADALSAGANSMCAREPGNANPMCWGANDNNILVPDDLNPIVPTRVAHGNNFLIGRGTACDLMTGCWGDNYLGQLGDGSFAGHNTPSPIVDLPALPSSIGVGYDHTCAVVNGQLFCWGDNVSGQLGLGTTTRALVPAPVSGLP